MMESQPDLSLGFAGKFLLSFLLLLLGFNHLEMYVWQKIVHCYKYQQGKWKWHVKEDSNTKEIFYVALVVPISPVYNKARKQFSAHAMLWFSTEHLNSKRLKAS